MSALLALTLFADLLVVANRGGATATIIDPLTMTVLANVAAGTQPHEAAISADGRLAYLTNYNTGTGSTLTVIDLATRERVKTIPIGLVGPHGIVERRGKLHFTAESSAAVGRYDPVTDRVDWIGRPEASGTHMLALSADASTVYTANIFSGSVSIIPVEEGGETVARKVISTVSSAEGIALSPDEREVWSGSVQNDGIAVIDLATETVVARFAQGLSAYRLVFTPDGTRVLVPRGSTVVVYNAATREIERTIAFGTRGQPLSIVIPPGTGYAFVSTAANRIEKIDLATFTFAGTAMAGPVPDGMAYYRAPLPRLRAIRRR